MATGMRANAVVKKEKQYGQSVCFKRKCKFWINKGGCKKIGKNYFNTHDWYSVNDGFCLAE